VFLHSDIKDFFKTQSFCRIPTHEQEKIKSTDGPLAWQKMIAYDSDVCLSVERIDGHFPIECIGGSLVRFTK
jgi:hypothetical protein